MKKNAFTMIELIFVIVILGILAAVAIPKLTATRDDALVSREVSNAKTTKQNMISSYLAQGVDQNATNTDCYTFTFSGGVLTVSKAVHNSAVYCNNVYASDISDGIDGVVKVGGTLVNYN